jgi:hypothetical protein
MNPLRPAIWIAIAALWVAFAAVCLALALSGGRAPLQRWKLKVGGLLLALGAVTCNGRPLDSWSCYEGDTDIDLDVDADADTDADTDLCDDGVSADEANVAGHLERDPSICSRDECVQVVALPPGMAACAPHAAGPVGRPVAAIPTDVDGRFFGLLPPGRYAAIAQSLECDGCAEFETSLWRSTKVEVPMEHR